MCPSRGASPRWRCLPLARWTGFWPRRLVRRCRSWGRGGGRLRGRLPALAGQRFAGFVGVSGHVAFIFASWCRGTVAAADSGKPSRPARAGLLSPRRSPPSGRTLASDSTVARRSRIRRPRRVARTEVCSQTPPSPSPSRVYRVPPSSAPQAHGCRRVLASGRGSCSRGRSLSPARVAAAGFRADSMSCSFRDCCAELQWSGVPAPGLSRAFHVKQVLRDSNRFRFW